MLLEHLTIDDIEAVQRLRNVWHGMRNRCQSAKSKGYERYGARGIRVCDEWNVSCAAFTFWALHNGYTRGLELDRQDNDGDYCPANCRFVTSRVNNLNRGNIIVLEDGRKLSDVAKSFGMGGCLAASRYRAGWSAERVFNEPVQVKRAASALVLADGRRLADACREDGVSYKLARSRWLRGWAWERIVSTPRMAAFLGDPLGDV